MSASGWGFSASIQATTENLPGNFAMLSVIVAEFLGANIGMGFLIVNQSSQMDAPGVFANVLILSAVGVIFHYGLQYLGNRLLFWAGSDARASG